MITVKESGFYSSIQDLGRFGYRHFGVPVSGAADQISASRVNALLENDSNAALLEMTMQGPVLEFNAPTWICFGGAVMDIRLDEMEIENDQIYPVTPGQILKCGRIVNGLRTYMGIKGGFQEPEILGSRSYFSSITPKSKLLKGDTLGYKPSADFQPKILKWSHPQHLDIQILECTFGPEYYCLAKDIQTSILDNFFTLGSEYNRMGCRLNESVPGHALSMITSSTLPGTVQLTPAGRLIILLCDGQTTGGYPRVLQLLNDSLAIIAQKRMGDRIVFKLSQS
jgi:biotin-dependent carboxylase-like uncharacterized protein